MALYETDTASRFSASGLFAVVMMLALIGTVVLDAYALSTLNS